MSVIIARELFTYVVVGLVRTLDGQTEVVGLYLGHGGELDAELSQVGTSDLLVKRLGEHVDTERVSFRVSPKGDLSQNLVGKRARHDCNLLEVIASGELKRAYRKRGDRYHNRG